MVKAKGAQGDPRRPEEVMLWSPRSVKDENGKEVVEPSASEATAELLTMVGMVLGAAAMFMRNEMFAWIGLFMSLGGALDTPKEKLPNVAMSLVMAFVGLAMLYFGPTPKTS